MFMRNKLRVVVASLMAVLFVLSFAVACAPATLTVEPDSVELTVGETQDLVVKQGDTVLDNKDVKFEMEDTAVASVSSRGKVTAKAAGETTLTVTYDKATAEIPVKVNPKAVVTVELQVDGAKVETLSLASGAEKTVTAVVTGSDAKPTWNGGNTDYITVTPAEDGKSATVKGISPTGNTPVSVYVACGGVTAELKVTVTTEGQKAGYYLLRDGGDPVHDGAIGQNKVPSGKWAFWRDQSDWNGGNVTMGKAEYLGDDEPSVSQAGSVHLTATITNPSDNNSDGRNPADTVQLFFRSPKTSVSNPSFQGLLENNKDYVLTAKIKSNAAGTVTVNGVEVDLVVGDNNISIPFHHADDGAIHATDDYSAIQWIAFHLELGSASKRTCLVPSGAVDITVSNLKWTEAGPATQLQVPTATLAAKVVTITDTVNTAGVKDYTVGFFKDGDSPAYSMTAKVGANTIDDSKWEDGTYTLKVRANAESILYTASEWSESFGSYTVANGGIVYDIPFSTESEIGEQNGWFRWNGEGGLTPTVAKFDKGTLTYNYPEGGNMFYSQQLFYRDNSLESGATYKISFDITATGANSKQDTVIITVNGTPIDITSGNGHYEGTKVAGPKTTLINVCFGQVDVMTVVVGNFTFTNFTFEKQGSAPAPEAEGVVVDPSTLTLGNKVNANLDTLTNGEEGVASANKDKLYYWYVAGDWGGCGTIVTMSKNAIENNAVVLTYHGGSVNFSVQLFYTSTALTADKTYVLNIKVNAHQASTIMINGASVNLTEGVNDIHVEFVLNKTGAGNNGISALDIQMPGTNNTTDVTYEFSDISWQEVQ